MEQDDVHGIVSQGVNEAMVSGTDNKIVAWADSIMA
jgi:hypothetical protein